jgi:tetratricopeptide (TPR) repeat protein
MAILFNLVFSLIGVAVIAWLFWRSLKNSDDAVRLIFKWVLSAGAVWVAIYKAMPAFGRGGLEAIYGLGLMMTAALFLNILWRHSVLDFLTKPLTGLFDGGDEKPEHKPFYSIAQTQRKKGNYSGAINEVRKQLEKFPDDFEGFMLLAAIQAENLNDLSAAEITLNKFCAGKRAPDAHVAAAWTAMADWHLKHGVDMDSARASLEKIITRFPETELALKAEQRLAHLTATEKILLDQHDRQKIVVREGVKNIGLLDSTEFLQPQEIDPGKLAATHVKHLEAHPHDSDTREKLAVIYARDFQRLDLATLELNHLINEPRHSPKQIAGWLNLLANFQTELGADYETVRATLHQIIERFPDLPLADVTRRRLERLSHDFKSKEKTPGVQLGVYEQNVGLKYGRPKNQ